MPYYSRLNHVTQVKLRGSSLNFGVRFGGSGSMARVLVLSFCVLHSSSIAFPPVLSCTTLQSLLDCLLSALLGDGRSTIKSFRSQYVPHLPLGAGEAISLDFYTSSGAQTHRSYAVGLLGRHSAKASIPLPPRAALVLFPDPQRAG
jgi:hypothetical protein